MQPAVIGIDPGVTGAAALWAASDRVVFYDFRGIERTIHTVRLWRDSFKIEAIGLEDPHPLSAGKYGVWKLKHNQGIWEAILHCAGLRFELIPPVSWKKIIPAGLVGKNKKKELAYAREIIPGSSRHLDLAKHHNRAEALLIAYYVKEKIRGKIT